MHRSVDASVAIERVSYMRGGLLARRSISRSGKLNCYSTIMIQYNSYLVYAKIQDRDRPVAYYKVNRSYAVIANAALENRSLTAV